eukprot:895977-Amorphochlora_amoeboformis.AAC.2
MIKWSWRKDWLLCELLKEKEKGRTWPPFRERWRVVDAMFTRQDDPPGLYVSRLGEMNRCKSHRFSDP